MVGLKEEVALAELPSAWLLASKEWPPSVATSRLAQLDLALGQMVLGKTATQNLAPDDDCQVLRKEQVLA